MRARRRAGSHSKKAAANATAFSSHPGQARNDASNLRLVEQGLDVFPVHEVLDERLEIVGTAVAIVDVVGVLPDVDAEDRGGTVHQRILAVRGLGDLELAVLDLEPGPAGAELTDAG